MKSKGQQFASFDLNPAMLTLPILTAGVDLSKGCPLMFTNQADTNCSADVPQFEHFSTILQVGESA
jgi:hypothetical protein